MFAQLSNRGGLSAKAWMGVTQTLAFTVVLLAGFGLRAQAQRAPSEHEPLHANLEKIYQATFREAEVTPEAREEFQLLIKKADEAYESKHDKGTARLIERNFQLLCSTVLKYAMHEGERKEKSMLTAFSVVVTVQSIQRAKSGLCPLWPFC